VRVYSLPFLYLYQVVVFGGNGYVGRRVLQSALTNHAAEVVSVNRSGPPSNVKESWVSQVKWVSGKLHAPHGDSTLHTCK